MIQELRRKLFALADETYKTFNEKLVPGTGETIGVRVPKVRELAKEVAKEDADGFLMEMEAAEGDDFYQEELMLWGMVIGYGKMPLEERFKRLDSWVPKINSWAVCDCGNSTLKFMKKYPEESFAYICKYLESENEYEVRFAAVTLMEYFITEEYIGRLLEIYRKISHEGYYVKMAVAWAVSVCYIKFPGQTRRLLEKEDRQAGGLEDWTHNKAIQKIRESRRVSEEEKTYLNGLKRKISGGKMER
ncbi:MAG: DNA alkylation repair protein [Lachnospiraceae bacterium]|nr:DNA alkylation repair protein [Lachnospiraceae bacterium]